MQLTPADKESVVWAKLKTMYEARLVTLRAMNDGALPEDQRNRLIGQIAEVKGLLALQNEKAVSPTQQAWE